jgi:3-hydroxypropanoate dehydrogenase
MSKAGMPDRPESSAGTPAGIDFTQPLDRRALDQLFREAHTQRRWAERAVPDDLLRQAYDLAKIAPTSGNSQPLRILFVRSAEAKVKLKPCLSPGNIEQTMAAPVTAIFAMDMEFHEHLPRLYPTEDARSWFAGKPEAIKGNAELGSALQAGYFILAARALGLGLGPMGGFSREKVNETFFAHTDWGRTWHARFLCNIGYPGKDGARSRDPRFTFDEACRIE